MKRIIAFLLVIFVLAALAACGGVKPADTASDTESPANTQANQTSALTEKPGDPGDTKAAETAAQSERAPVAGSEGLKIREYEDSCEVADIGTFSGTELIIPSHVNGKPVTHIDEDAISNDSMTSLIIPWTVVSIGEDAASESHNLETVSFSDGLIGIGLGSFAGCPKLKTVTLPSTLERVGQSAFQSCAALTEVTLNGNADMAKYAFTECPALNKITYTDKSGKAYSLGTSAFERDTALEEVTFTEGLETIGSFCFDGCSSLVTVYLPASLSKIESNAFQSVGSLKVYYAGSEDQWKNINTANGNDALVNAEIVYNYK